MTMNKFPIHVWNENNKCDLYEFLKTANDCKTNEYCNKEDYSRLKPLFPLSEELKKELQVYSEEANVCIDITQSDDEEIQKYEIPNITSELQDIQSISFNDRVENESADFIEQIKDSLRIEKSVSEKLFKDLLDLDSQGMEKVFCNFAKELTLEDIQSLWNSLTSNNISNDLLIESYVHFLFLPKVKEEFVSEILEIFLELGDKQGTVLKSELIKDFIQADQKDKETTNIVLQYVTSLSDSYKMHILRDFINTTTNLHPNHVPIIETLLNPQLDIEVLAKVIDIMAASATEFCDDNAYGKLLFKTINLFDGNPSGLEKPLRSILGTHKSIWKVKVEKIFASWFNDTLTQSFI